MHNNFHSFPHSDAINSQRGFTLIELSIVLVIIGLIVGGIFVGQDLINAARLRSQISQIDKYNQAVNAFRDKYGGLPGDLPATTATQLGFTSRNGTQGNGDGNGVIEGTCCWVQTNIGMAQGQGETDLFWVDLTNANLIDTPIYQTNLGGGNWLQPSMYQWFPQAKIANQNNIYVYSWNGINYFGLSVATGIGSNGGFSSSLGLSAIQAYNIDFKIDDGLPMTGKVIAFSVLNGQASAAPQAIALSGARTAAWLVGKSVPPSSTSCFDNGNNSAAIYSYSLSQNNGANTICALSFQFQ